MLCQEKPYTFRCKIQIIWLKITYFIGMSQFFYSFALYILQILALYNLQILLWEERIKVFVLGWY